MKLALFALVLFASSQAFADTQRIPLCSLASSQGWDCGLAQSVTVKSGTGKNKATNVSGGPTCYALCTPHTVGTVDYDTSCTSTTYNGYVCDKILWGVPQLMRGDEANAADETIATEVSQAIDGQSDETIQSRAASYFGYYNSTLKSPTTGASTACAARIHVCFVHGFSDLNGVTDQNGCNNACNSATNTNQAECYDTDCSSRCGGWWGGTDSCS